MLHVLLLSKQKTTEVVMPSGMRFTVTMIESSLCLDVTAAMGKGLVRCWTF